MPVVHVTVEQMECNEPGSRRHDPYAKGAWPNGCYDPDTCDRHKCCMYVGCPHAGKNLEAAIVIARGEEGMKSDDDV